MKTYLYCFVHSVLNDKSKIAAYEKKV